MTSCSEDGVSAVFLNVGILSLHYAASHPRRALLESSSLWKASVSQLCEPSIGSLALILHVFSCQNSLHTSLSCNHHERWNGRRHSSCEFLRWWTYSSFVMADCEMTRFIASLNHHHLCDSVILHITCSLCVSHGSSLLMFSREIITWNFIIGTGVVLRFMIRKPGYLTNVIRRWFASLLFWIRSVNITQSTVRWMWEAEQISPCLCVWVISWWVSVSVFCYWRTSLIFSPIAHFLCLSFFLLLSVCSSCIPYTFFSFSHIPSLLLLIPRLPPLHFPSSSHIPPCPGSFIFVCFSFSFSVTLIYHSSTILIPSLYTLFITISVEEPQSCLHPCKWSFLWSW